MAVQRPSWQSDNPGKGAYVPYHSHKEAHDNMYFVNKVTSALSELHPEGMALSSLVREEIARGKELRKYQVPHARISSVYQIISSGPQSVRCDHFIR